MGIDFDLIEASQARARRERSAAMYAMLIAPLIALFKRPAGRKQVRRRVAEPQTA